MSVTSRPWSKGGISLAIVMIFLAEGCSRGQESMPAVHPVSPILPVPRKLALREGAFVITTATPVHHTPDPDARRIAGYFIDLAQRMQGLALTATEAEDAGNAPGIHFDLQAGEAAGDEGYSLSVSPTAITVVSRSPRGLFYGAVTLSQLLAGDGNGGAIRVPALRIEDAPRFRWRGLMLDSARHYQSPAFIRAFIDWMALHKLNVLHWHLVDDQGWRLEIKKYPRLTGIGAWRVPAGPVAAADLDPATGKPRLHGGYYTQDEVRELVAHAAARNITIVPEIEMPGHATASVVAYPRLGVDGRAPAAVPSDWGIYPTLYNIDEATFAFLEDVLVEVMDLFPGAYIHVGGDEAVKDQWKASPQVQARMRVLGIQGEHALQSYFIQRIGQFLDRHGRKLIGWDEILEGGLAPDAVVMSWRGIDGAVAAATAGHDAVLAPHPTLYFDNRQNGPHDPSPGRGRVITVEDVYRFDPAPASLEPAQQQHILGVQANIFTEHMSSEERVEHMTYPRAAALAEVAWSPAEKLDWADFQRRLPIQLRRYDALGIHYAPLATDLDAISSPTHRNSHQLKTCGNQLVLSLSDDAPLQGERAVFLVDIMNPCWIFPQADLSQVTGLEAAVGQVPFNFQVGKDVESIPLEPPRSKPGELVVRMDGCAGEVIAALPLAPAASNPAVTRLPRVAITPRPGKHDLCMLFTRASVDPIWVIDTFNLVQ